MMADLKSIQDQIYCSGEKKMRNRDGVDNTNALYLFKKSFWSVLVGYSSAPSLLQYISPETHNKSMRNMKKKDH